MLALYSIWHREIVRFLGDRARVFSSVGQPLLFWALFAGALRDSFQPVEGMGYGEYFFPGTLAMVVLFTAIFATITVIEDRKEGFLQTVLIAPVSRASIALGKILGATTLAMFHAAMFFALAPFIGIELELVSVLAAFGVLLLLAIALTGVGFTLAWLMDSTAGYHGIMTLLLMPMLLLSGAFFPAAGAHPILAWLMVLNPLSYGVAALRYSLYGGDHGAVADLPALWICLAVTVAFLAVSFTASTLIVLRRTARDTV